MFVETDMLGYFNILQRFWTEDEEAGGEAQGFCFWGVDVFFDGDGTGVVMAEGDTIAFSYTADTWTAVSATIDVDLNEAAISIGGSEVHSWAWNVGTDGENNCHQLGGVNFYGIGQDSGGDGGEPSFFIDDVSFAQQ
jgi:hypothetical protein